jgi:hypothetical protein
MQWKSVAQVSSVVTCPQDNAQIGNQTIIVQRRPTEPLSLLVEQHTINRDQYLLAGIEHVKARYLFKMSRYGCMTVVKQVNHNAPEGSA